MSLKGGDIADSAWGEAESSLNFNLPVIPMTGLRRRLALPQERSQGQPCRGVQAPGKGRGGEGRGGEGRGMCAQSQPLTFPSPARQHSRSHITYIAHALLTQHRAGRDWSPEEQAAHRAASPECAGPAGCSLALLAMSA